MRTFELRIRETGRSKPSDVQESFNTIEESFESKEKLVEYLIDRYGKMPCGRKKIYRDIDTNFYSPKIMAVGFLRSFWNQDISHNSKKWFQTDWIEFFEQETTKTYFKI